MRDYIDNSNTKRLNINKDNYTKILDYNNKRSYVIICNDCNTKEQIYITLNPIESENKDKHIIIEGKKCWIMPTDSIYIGEICAIASIDNTCITVTEY